VRIVVVLVLAICAVALVPAATADSGAPSVRVKRPSAEQVVHGWTKLDVHAMDDVAVARVTYFVDGTRVAFDETASDWNESWDSRTVADGMHTLVAEARDAAGNATMSEPVSFIVANDGDAAPPPAGDTAAPTVSVTSPRSGTVVSGSVVVDATASDDVGVVDVVFVVDGTVVGSVATPPSWSWTWDSRTVADGAHTLVARARDAAGNVGESTGVTLTVENDVAIPSPPPTACQRPYAASSPWNVPVRADAVVHRDSAFYVSSLTPTLTSDPTQYTYPVYNVDGSTPLRTVTISGRFSNVTGETTIQNQSSGSTRVPIPADAEAAAGSDAQLIILNPATGDEWGFWQLSRDTSGNWSATNGYHYNTKWSGVPPSGFVSRGAGVPYLAGLVRPCELERGFIDHALAFAYDYPSAKWIFPATKSDGKSTAPNALPEGARLQLDPSLTRADLTALGITGPALVVAEALQRYGMYDIDNSGRDKLMMAYEGTADWNGRITASTVSKIPLALFRWVETP
jgi:hypothetical protein